MNWDAAGAIGEIVGALAVVITLVYLAIQVRQNTRHVQAQMGHAGWISSADYELAQMEQAAAETLAKASFEPDSLSDTDVKVLDAFYKTLFFHIARVEHMNSLGLEIYTTEQTAQGFIDQFNNHTGKAWWRCNSALIDELAPKVRKRMEELFESPESPSRHLSLVEFRRLVTGKESGANDT